MWMFTSECDGRNRGSVVSRAVQEFSVASHYNVDQDDGGCGDLKAAPNVYYSNRLGISGHGYQPTQSEAFEGVDTDTKGQHGNDRSTEKNT